MAGVGVLHRHLKNRCKGEVAAALCGWRRSLALEHRDMLHQKQSAQDAQAQLHLAQEKVRIGMLQELSEERLLGEQLRGELSATQQSRVMLQLEVDLQQRQLLQIKAAARVKALHRAMRHNAVRHVNKKLACAVGRLQQCFWGHLREQQACVLSTLELWQLLCRVRAGWDEE